MEITRQSDEFSTCGQITLHDVPVIAAMGFKTILCNRPDGESADQVLFSSIETEAALSGMHAEYMPIATGGPEADDVARLARILPGLPGPVLAYCRSGGRSQRLWSAAQKQP